MTSNYNYIQILADIYNKQRTTAICTAAFASWTVLTPADDEFIGECMTLFCYWTRTCYVSMVISCSRCYNSDDDESDYGSDASDNDSGCSCAEQNLEGINEFRFRPLPSSYVAFDNSYLSEEKDNFDFSYLSEDEDGPRSWADSSSDEDSEEERTSGILRRTNLAGYTPVPSECYVSRGTAAFASWTIVTPADDEFVEECMTIFLFWTTPRRWCQRVCSLCDSDSDSDYGSESDVSDVTSDSDSICSCAQHRLMAVNRLTQFPQFFDSQPLPFKYVETDFSYKSDVATSLSWLSSDEEERARSILRRSGLAGYTPIPSECDVSSESDSGEREAIERMLADIMTSSTDSCSTCDVVEKEAAAVCHPGPFVDLLARLLPPKGTPIVVNGLLVPSENATEMGPSSSALSSLFLRGQSLSHHSILSISSSIDAHVCGSECEWYETLPTEEECEPLLDESTSTFSTTSSADTEEDEVCPGPFADLVARLLPPLGTPLLINGRLVPTTVSDGNTQLAIRLMEECDEMMERIVEFKKRLMAMG